MASTQNLSFESSEELMVYLPDRLGMLSADFAEPKNGGGRRLAPAKIGGEDASASSRCSAIAIRGPSASTISRHGGSTLKMTFRFEKRIVR